MDRNNMEAELIDAVESIMSSADMLGLSGWAYRKALKDVITIIRQHQAKQPAAPVGGELSHD